MRALDLFPFRYDVPAAVQPGASPADRPRRRPLHLALALLLAAPVALGAAAPAEARLARASDRQVGYHAWDSRAQLEAGRLVGVRVAKGRLRLDSPTKSRSMAGRRWDLGRWVSPWVSPGFDFTELVPSWDARTPEGTVVEVQARGRTADGRRSSWDTLGRWTAGDDRFHRTSLASQTDDLAHVSTDTWVAGSSFATWQLRVHLLREQGVRRTPRIDAVGAMVSRVPSSTGAVTSRPGVAARAGGITLSVPRLSQMIHEGHFPQYGGGGESWCSPTSLTMVLGYYGVAPARAETAWVGKHRQRVVDHVARMTYDYRYQGTGNWPFNTAYASTRLGGRGGAFVTRFPSLRQVERFIKAGIPVITSLDFEAGGLDGAPISATNGHLMVVVGFTASGDVVVNDPAADRGPGVRRTYDRGQFESAWLKRGQNGGSGGLAYVLHDADHPLPARHGATSW